MTIERDQSMTVRLTRAEHHMVKALAETTGVSISDVVRILLRREHAAVFGAPNGRAKR